MSQTISGSHHSWTSSRMAFLDCNYQHYKKRLAASISVAEDCKCVFDRRAKKEHGRTESTGRDSEMPLASLELFGSFFVKKKRTEINVINGLEKSIRIPNLCTVTNTQTYYCTMFLINLFNAWNGFVIISR